MGADDCEGNVIHVAKYRDQNGDHHVDSVFTLPADAFRDKQMMEWILAPKSADETTNSDFTDLITGRFNERVNSVAKLGMMAQF